MKKKVLIIDHDLAFATILKEALESSGDYEASIATTGEEGLAKSIEEHPRMVIVDMGLKDINPESLIQTLRDVKPHLKILAIPFGDSPIPEKLGVDGIIPKPFFVGDLPEIMGKALSQREVVAAPPAREFTRWAEEIFQELSPELLTFGDSDPRFWAGGDREEASKLFQWVAKVLEENPYSHAHSAEIYYRSEKRCIYGTRLSDGSLLAMAFSREVPLGMIRLVVKKKEVVPR
ncbi:MAG: response regulator [Anaerolineae bacterium]|nr:response regulator [Anaerolineae bacterium]MDW8101846.1 response regulator [Anaerolineae bacterium]